MIRKLHNCEYYLLIILIRLDVSIVIGGARENGGKSLITSYDDWFA